MGIGHDEEVGGGFGAKQIAQKIESLGLKVALVWDEGMTVLSDGVGKLLPAPVACVGVAEKVSTGTAGVILLPANLAQPALSLQKGNPPSLSSLHTWRLTTAALQSASGLVALQLHLCVHTKRMQQCVRSTLIAYRAGSRSD